MNNIVLVHGAFVDGAHWEGVYKILKRDGYSVSVVQNPTISLEDDVAVTRRVLATQKGPAILVGHSYGGAVITEAGNDPKVAALVYIAAFAPDRGESVATLTKDPPPDAPVSPMLPPQDGFLFLDKARFAASYALTTRAQRPISAAQVCSSSESSAAPSFMLQPLVSPAGTQPVSARSHYVPHHYSVNFNESVARTR
jgi:pimeloyl-ACP methyl ester carboxylesterase